MLTLPVEFAFAPAACSAVFQLTTIIALPPRRVSSWPLAFNGARSHSDSIIAVEKLYHIVAGPAIVAPTHQQQPLRRPLMAHHARRFRAA